MKIIIIAALAQNNVIGKDGSIPWHSKAEFQHFKKTTMGFPIIMGRKTFDSIGKPLKGRLNIVLSRDVNYLSPHPEVIKFESLEYAVRYCLSAKFEKVFIIGGAELYNTAIPDADELLLTRMPFEIEGDTFFPEIDKEIWELKNTENHEEFRVESYERKS
ncbi:MAG: dihydrofolate reductase [Melioribacteraceae bacterium]|nr:dihydrofolate reductase [Melioribacteraceae bacterium]MCF8395108.1 dihydrofolate reductase [Melioribacteraceae bacterium]MCF8420517.1 dihydrofolate reductase [Melioribacteraceae bacterium]